MKKIASFFAIILLAAMPAFATDTFVTTPHPQAVFDSTLGQLYSICPPGQATACTVIPSAATTNAWSGANNFTGTFEIGGTTESFPASGSIAGTTDAQTLTNKTITNPVINGATGVGQTIGAVSTASTVFTSNATLGAITGLSVPVVAGGTYFCEAYLPITANASGGVQVAFAGASSMTATSASYTGSSYNGATLSALSTTTTFGNAVGAATAADTFVSLKGVIVVNAAGNLIVEGAQNASNASATTFLANSSIGCIRTN